MGRIFGRYFEVLVTLWTCVYMYIEAHTCILYHSLPWCQCRKKGLACCENVDFQQQDPSTTFGNRYTIVLSGQVRQCKLELPILTQLLVWSADGGIFTILNLHQVWHTRNSSYN